MPLSTSGQPTDGTPTNGGNKFIDSLVWGDDSSGGMWEETEPSGRVTIGYTLMSGTPPEGLLDDGDTTYEWGTVDEDAIGVAFDAWEAVANIEFVAEDEGTSNIWYWLTDDTGLSSDFGYHEVPYEDPEPLYAVFNADVTVPSEGGGDVAVWNGSGLALGGYGFITLIHEIGHGLGLAHPHDGGGTGGTTFPGVGDEFDDYGNDGQNQGIFTTMGYNDGWPTAPGSIANFYEYPYPQYFYGWQAGPMALDIAAVQILYGANNSYNPTDSYALPSANAAGTYWKCIWDTGGTDTMSAAGASAAAVINLNEAPLTGSNAGGFPSRVVGIAGGFTIANGVTIENAIGGGGNDSITGNAVANVLTGGAGSDRMLGNAGADRLVGGTGADSLFGGSSADVLTGGTGADRFVFDAVLGTADTIKDFRTAQGDKIALDDDIFTAIGIGLGQGEFKATDTIKPTGTNGVGRHLLYDTDTGKLYYDADAGGATKQPVLIAKLTNADGSHPSLAHTDFQVVG